MLAPVSVRSTLEAKGPLGWRTSEGKPLQR